MLQYFLPKLRKADNHYCLGLKDGILLPIDTGTVFIEIKNMYVVFAFQLFTHCIIKMNIYPLVLCKLSI